MRDALDAERLDELQRHDENIAALQYQRDALYERLKAERLDKRETVTELLYELQETLEEDESVALLRMTEDYGRGGWWRYDEVLTSKGMVAEAVTHTYGSRSPATVADLSRWPDDEPLDIASDYLTGDRARPQYIDKLADRIQTIAEGGDEVPSHGLRYLGGG